MKKFLRKLLAFIAISVIVNTATTWVLDHTLLSSSFVLKQAKEHNFYPELSKAIPLFLHQNEDESTRQAADVVTQVVTPSFLEDKFSGYVVDLEKHYREDGPSPSIDLTDLRTAATAKGLPLPPDALQQPLRPGDPINVDQGRWLMHHLGLFEYGGAIVSLIFLGLIWLAAEPSRRYRAVAANLLISAICLVPTWALFQVGPDIADSALKNNPDLLALEPSLKALVGSVFKAAGKQFLIAGAILVVLAVVVYIVHFVVGRRGRPKKMKPLKRQEGGLMSNG